MKPLYLAERFATARVRQEEADARNSEIEAEIKLLKAKTDYERTMALIRNEELEAKGKFLKTLLKRILLKLRRIVSRSIRI